MLVTKPVNKHNRITDGSVMIVKWVVGSSLQQRAVAIFLMWHCSNETELVMNKSTYS